MHGPLLNTLQNDGVHGWPSSTLHGAWENGVASIWRRDCASAALKPINMAIRLTMVRQNMQRVLKGDPTKLMCALAGIKAGGVHIAAFTAEESPNKGFPTPL